MQPAFSSNLWCSIWVSPQFPVPCQGQVRDSEWGIAEHYYLLPSSLNQDERVETPVQYELRRCLHANAFQQGKGKRSHSPANKRQRKLHIWGLQLVSLACVLSVLRRWWKLRIYFLGQWRHLGVSLDLERWQTPILWHQMPSHWWGHAVRIMKLLTFVSI